MRIAIVGTGIAGMTAAYLLHEDHEITVYESEHRIGGHTHTVPVDYKGQRYWVDTGFIVYNEWTYPNFIHLLDRLGVATQPSTMGFSIRCARTGLEYSSQKLFAQRRNLLRLAHYQLIGEILRFNAAAYRFLEGNNHTALLEDFLSAENFSDHFQSHYLRPMLAAIWSADPARVFTFPARHLLSFFANHGLLNAFQRPQWRVIQGGSHRYMEKLTAPYRDRIRLATPVASVDRIGNEVSVRTAKGDRELYDHVILATHSDVSLGLLGEATPAEREILGALPYQRNEVVLHTDSSLLPREKRAWTSWNYYLPEAEKGLPSLTYNMNILQGIDAPLTFCVTLNQSEAIDPQKIIRRFSYDHPFFSLEGLAAQQRHAEISGVGGIHYCGAYWGYGFHEDGVNSALAVARYFGKGWDDAQLPLPRRRAASPLHAH